jgi:glycosyltransferase involved in cell wall biosynthesis
MPPQGYQINEAVLQASLEAERARHPQARHVIVSFSLVRLGYTCQRLADATGWPHIAVVTGSDFACDLSDPALGAAAAHVVRRADWIVALNETHRAALSVQFARHERLSVLHGALPAGAPVSTWQPHDRNERVIVCDAGYSFKKATQLLIGACDRLRDAGRDVQLSIVGRTAAEEAAYWAQFQSDAGRRSRPWAAFGGFMPKSQMEQFLLAGDIYCSASLGEGSSNASLFALALGMPMVCTRTGSLPDLADAAGDWLALVTPGDEAALADALGTMLNKLADKTIDGPHGGVDAVRRRLAPQREVEAWIALLDRLGDRR